MARERADQNADILRYALRHLEQERDEIQARIDHVTRQLGRRVSGSNATAPANSSAVPAPASGGKRVLSDAARKRIAAAQKRRWAAHRKAQAKAS